MLARSVKVRLVVIAVLVSIAVVGWGASTSTVAQVPGAIKRGGTLRIAHGHTVTSLDIHRDVGTAGLYVLNQVTESLLRVNNEGKVFPALAVRMPAIIESRDYVFDLRRGVKFHDGTEFDAEDVKFTFDRLLDPQRSQQAGRVAPFIQGVEVINKYRVRIRLKQPWVDFLTIMAHDKLFNIINRESVEKYGNDYGVVAESVVGTGPFAIKRYAKADFVALGRNPDYWGVGKPYVDEIIYREIPEASTRAVAFESGDVDVNQDIPHKDAKPLQRLPAVRVYRAGGGIMHYIVFNTSRSPLDRNLVRRALSMAINRKQLVDVVFDGFAEPATSIFPSWNRGYVRDVALDPYDVAKARELLSAAGYGSGRPLSFTLQVRAGKIQQDAAVLVQRYWASVGVRVTLEVVDPRALTAVMTEGKHVAVLSRLGYGPPATDYAFRTYSNQSYLNYSRFNVDRQNNPRAEELLRQAAITIDSVKERAINMELAKMMFLDEVPAAVLAFEDNLDATHSYVRGWGIISLDYLPRTEVWLDK